jgi:hypothetical protein
MTNKDKIIRYLECWLRVKATDEEWYNFMIYAKDIDSSNDECFIAHHMDTWGADTYPLDSFKDDTIIPIPLKPNYQPGDLVTILPIAREIENYHLWSEGHKGMVDSWVHEIKEKSLWDIAIYTKDKSNNWYFPSWAIAPVFPDATYTGKDIVVTIDGKEYKATIQ